jgi:hypothetical protein
MPGIEVPFALHARILPRKRTVSVEQLAQSPPGHSGAPAFSSPCRHERSQRRGRFSSCGTSIPCPWCTGSGRRVLGRRRWLWLWR